ncbi:MAG: DUF1565 domain-containing protein [Lentisphaerae bacterium]|nr:DUF1565 domain-containing protein [Lentisphaerota bacterium]
MKKFILFVLFCCAALTGAELFVGKNAQYKTIKSGIAAMKPGDTLTILPGVYRESIEFANLGAPGKTTTIRAKLPGTVLLKGDKDAPAFKRVPGTRFTWVTDWKERANCVIERDTFKILLPAATVRELEFNRGVFLYDKANGKLYISSSDGKEPSEHFYTISVINTNALYLQKPVNVVIEGLMVTGYYSHEKLVTSMSSSAYAIRINHPVNSTIRNCKAFFNANGIHIGHGDGGTIDNCTVFANGSYNPSSGGGLVVWCPAKNATIKNSLSFYSAKPAGPIGIRIYGADAVNCKIENCTSFGDEATAIKARNINSWIINSFSQNGLHTNNAKNCTSDGVNAFGYEKNLLRIDKIRKSEHDSLFADPENYDYRPQEGASGVSHGLKADKNLYFISPFGKDSNSGRSVRNAWRSFSKIPAGATVYLLPGAYSGAKITVPNVSLRTRGTGARAVFTSSLVMTGDNVTLKDINFIGGKVTLTGKNATVTGCGFAVPLEITNSLPSVTHCAFLKDPKLPAENIYHSNIDAKSPVRPQYVNAEGGDFTLKNFSAFAGRGFDGLPIGPYRLSRSAKPTAITGPFIRSMSSTTANIEWWTDKSDVSSELRWGADPSCGKRIGSAWQGGSYHCATLTGLVPGKKYYFHIASRTPLRECHGNMELALQDEFKPRELVRTPTREFTLPVSAKRAAREFFVAPNGSDSAAGSKAKPFKTIAHALDQAVAGDTVTVQPGVYNESLRFRSGGDKNAPLTLRAAKPGTVFIDGFRKIITAIALENVNYVVIDGLTFREINDTTGACISINGGENITIKRCFQDGRSHGYTPAMITAHGVRKLTVENCVIIRGFHGSTFYRCPELVIKNCVWYVNQIRHFYAHCHPEEKVLVENNIFVDNVPPKHSEALISVFHLEALKMRNNAFYLRMPQEHRAIAGFTRKNGNQVRSKSNLAMLRAAGADEKGTIFANPGFNKVMPKGIVTFKTAPKLTQASITRSMNYNKEALELGKLYPAAELGLVNGQYTPWKITDFIATNPELLKKKIGLDPDAFK